MRRSFLSSPIQVVPRPATAIRALPALHLVLLGTVTCSKARRAAWRHRNPRCSSSASIRRSMSSAISR